MKKVFHKIISMGLVFVMLFSMTATALAASNNTYVEGNPENIVVSFNQLSGSTYKVTIRNDKENAIEDWSLSFKTNFKLSNPEGANWSVSKNNTYTFTDPENGRIASGGSFSFTIESNKKKNSDIHNVHFEYENIKVEDMWQLDDKDTDGDGLPDWIENIFGTDATKADTDGDGLTDYDEYVTILTDPLKRDSVGKGYCDAEYDFDSDGLTNIEEILIGSNPYKEDTDEDGLTDADERSCGTDPNDSDTDDDGMVDGAEAKYNMDPTNPDTLGNGVLDGDRVFDVVQENRDAFGEYGITTSVTTQLKGNQIHTLSIEKVDITDPFLSDQVPGFLGNAFEYTVGGEFDKAVIEYQFPKNLLDEDDFEPAIFYFDEDDQILIPLENQRISGNVITAETTHFSKYILLNKRKYQEVWKYDFKFDSSEQSGQAIRMSFVIDYSASMAINDPQYVRLTLVNNLIDRMREGIDEASVIKFAGYATVLSSMSLDKKDLKSVVSSIKNTGDNTIFCPDAGTNGSDGLRKAIDTFTDSKGYNYIVFLTDGEDNRQSYDYSDLVNDALEKNVMINCIGMGSSIDAELLTEIAEATGGSYYYAEDADELYGIFDDIANESDLKKDSDSDGINDYFEKEMSAGRLRLGTGVPLIGIDYLNADSDGDSLTDGKEMSVEKTKKRLDFLGSEKVYVKLYSNPTSMDTDKDGIMDAEDERPLYAFGFNYLGSKAHLKSVEEQMTLKMQDAYLYGDNITNIIGMWGTEILMADYYDFLAYKGVDPSVKNREDYWDESWDKYWNTYCDKINEYVSLRGAVDKELHYFRNNLNRYPATLDEMISNYQRWTLLSVGASIYHMNPTDFSGSGLYNLKFISNDGKYEAVYVNTYGNESNKGLAVTDRTDPTNMGTYNYCGEYVSDGAVSISGARHWFYDIAPYNSYGNTSPDDKPKPGMHNDDRFKNSDGAVQARERFLISWKGGANE